MSKAVAKSYYKQGEILYKAFSDISLKGNKSQVAANLRAKEEALRNAAGPYAKSIEIGVEEWTLRSTFKIGQSFVDFADAIEDQSLEGAADQKMAAKIKILSSLDKYYVSALKYFQKNIEWAYDQNISGEYVTKSMDMFMKVLFLRANALEKVGIILKTSPIPKDLSKEEKQAYQELLEEKSLEAMDKGPPAVRRGNQGRCRHGNRPKPVAHENQGANPGDQSVFAGPHYRDKSPHAKGRAARGRGSGSG